MRGSMTSLVAFGCSHTDAAKNLPTPWVSRLGRLTGWDVTNYGSSGGSNEFIFRNAIKYLAQGNTPDYLIVQWTELKRYLMPITDGMIQSWSNTDLNLGDDMWMSCKLPKQNRHPKFFPEQEMILIWTLCLQEFCEKHEIDCRFVTYCDLGSIPDNPLWNHIDTSKFLHCNFENGWLNHCMWSFGHKEAIIQLPTEKDAPLDRVLAAGHLNDVAIDYTAKCWYNYLIHNKQYDIEEQDYIHTRKLSSLVFRYTGEEKHV